jgi:hypothetical protein
LTVDDFNSVLIQAESKTGVTRVSCEWEFFYSEDIDEGDNESEYWRKGGDAYIDITVVPVTVEIEERQVIPPMVGSSLSTSVLYLVSNCGPDEEEQFPEAEFNCKFSDIEEDYDWASD